MAMGPFAMSDLAGNDIGWHIRKRRALETSEFAYSKIPTSSAGSAASARRRVRDSTIQERSRAPIPTGRGQADRELPQRSRPPARAIEDKEIVERCIFALVNEGARILEEGIALRAVDIDMVLPRRLRISALRGGPMFHATRRA